MALPLIKIENPRTRLVAQTVGFTIVVFVGQLLLGDGSVLGRLIASVVAGAVLGVFLTWLYLRSPRAQSRP